jgi:transcriptional regulator with XRE-family HTH domain
MTRTFHNPPSGGDLPTGAPKDAVRREFAKRLQAALTEKGWNQAELARNATRHMPDGKTIGRDSVSGYIRALSTPNPGHLAAICAALDMKPADLLPVKGIPSVENRTPPLDISDVGQGKAWLRVNQAVDWAVALKVLELLKGA